MGTCARATPRLLPPLAVRRLGSALSSAAEAAGSVVCPLSRACPRPSLPARLMAVAEAATRALVVLFGSLGGPALVDSDAARAVLPPAKDNQEVGSKHKPMNHWRSDVVLGLQLALIACRAPTGAGSELHKLLTCLALSA